MNSTNINGGIVISCGVALGLALGVLLGAAAVESGGLAFVATVGGAIIAGVVGLACGLFYFARRFVRLHNRPLVGQLGGPIIGGLAAVFGAYLALSSVSRQISVQREMLETTQRSEISSQIAAARQVAIALSKTDWGTRLLCLDFATAIWFDGTQKYKQRAVEARTYLTELEKQADAFEELLARTIFREGVFEPGQNYIDAVRYTALSATVAINQAEEVEKGGQQAPEELKVSDSQVSDSCMKLVELHADAQVAFGREIEFHRGRWSKLPM